MDAGHKQQAEPLPAIRPPSGIWLLLGGKPGDNGQVLALAEALGWPYSVKRLVYRRTELLTNRLFGAALLGIDRRRSSPLTPPWPELVISAGRRNEPVARWIQDQARGTRCVRLVHVGRPWASLDAFDLIITTPQYELPQRANILHNEAPMHRVSRTRLREAGAAWAARLAHLPRPWLAAMLGGHVGPYSFDPPRGARLGSLIADMVRPAGGSVLVTTSARTPPSTAEACIAAIDVPCHVYRWRRDDPDNPYLAYLALADSIVVTSDSMSMLIEAIASGKPVHIFDLATPGPAGGWRAPRLGAVLWRLGRMAGPRRLARDIGIIHRRQVAAGRAVWLDQPWNSGRTPPPLADTAHAAERVRALFAADRDQG